MAKKAVKKNSEKKTRGEIGGYTEKIVGLIQQYSTPLTIILLIIIIAVGTYIRVVPALKYDIIELDANDPWIAYWEAKWFLENGLFNFEGLKNVKDFWWPIGRDFTETDYLGVAWFAAATYPIAKLFGLTLKEWLALFPVFAGIFNIIFSFVLVYVVTRSKLAGLVAATFFALFPGAISRTTIGFVEKTGIATPVLSIFYTFFFLALREVDKRRARIYAVLAGITGGLVAFIWGGYHLVTITLALAPLIEPIFARPSRERLEIYAITAGVYMLAAIISPVVSVTYFVAGIGLAVPAALAIYTVETNISRIPLLSKIIGETVTPKFQIWLLAVFAVVGLLALYGNLVPVGARLLATIGIRNVSPLVESVQEHQPASLAQIFNDYGIPLVLAIIGISYFLFRVLTGRADYAYAMPRAVIYSLLVLLVLSNKQLAYFSQMASYYASIAAGLAVADLIGGAILSEARGKGKKPRHQAGDPLKVLVAIFIVALVGISAAYYGYVSYTSNQYRAPQILTGGLGPLTVTDPNTGQATVVIPFNGAWTNALEWIKENTPEDALIVSWWDYGYWITVNTGRKTVADGATLNETQIRALARLLTGKEGEANYILRNILKAEPNKTYIVVYDIFQGTYDAQNNVFVLNPMPRLLARPQLNTPGAIMHGLGDLPKSFQMLRIGYRVDPFTPSPYNTPYSSIFVDQSGYKWAHFPGFIGQPETNVELVRETLLYKMMINGIPNMIDVAVPDAACQPLIENATAAIMTVATSEYYGTGQFQLAYVLPGAPFESFQLAAVSIGCPVVQPVEGGNYNIVAVMVFIYQWTG